MRCAISALSLLLLSTALLGSAFAEDKPLTREAAKALFDKSDRALNEAWAAAKKALSEEEFIKLKEDQRAWVWYRDILAQSTSYAGSGLVGDDGLLPLDSLEYFRAATGVTDERAAWLRGLVTQWSDDNLTGVWNDSRGGYITIVEKDGHLYFEAECARGPFIHMGTLSGVATWNSPIGWFSDKGQVNEKEEETNLSFVLRDNKLQITGANTRYYHGSRAYFDGSYVRVESLTPRQQLKIIKSVTTGEEPEK